MHVELCLDPCVFQPNSTKTGVPFQSPARPTTTPRLHATEDFLFFRAPVGFKVSKMGPSGARVRISRYGHGLIVAHLSRGALAAAFINCS